MKIKKVVLDYSGFYDDELNTLAGKVLDCLEGHAVFVELPVTLEVLQAQAEDFRSKWQTASNGGSLLQIAVKNDAKALLAGSLKDIAFYVNKVAAGSRSLLLSSGLQMEADPKPKKLPNTVTGEKLQDGRQRDQMDVLFNPVGRNHVYEYQIADTLDEQGQPIWNRSFHTGDSRGNVFAPTVPDTVYYMRVRAINNKGAGDWSTIAALKAR